MKYFKVKLNTQEIVVNDNSQSMFKSNIHLNKNYIKKSDKNSFVMIMFAENFKDCLTKARQLYKDASSIEVKEIKQALLQLTCLTLTKKLLRRSMTMINQENEQVVDNTNTSSETIKNHYVVSDVKADSEIIFDFYPTSMKKKVYWEVHSDEDEYEVSDNKVFLNEKDAEKSVEDFKKEPVDYEEVRSAVEDRFYDTYTIHADNEDDDGNIFVSEDSIETSSNKMSVSDYIKTEIQKKDSNPYIWWGKDNSSLTEKENIVIEQLNRQLKRQDIDYECVKLLSDNSVTFGLIKKEKIDETKSN
tara:strand:+ start:353 stop:1258 length:906 start_codon:yes stop_codon:yes gene_type:complete